MNNKDMNYIFFITLCIIFITLFHYVYLHIYESINLYSTYEKNIMYINDNINDNDNDNDNDNNNNSNNTTDILKEHLHNKLIKQPDNINETI